MALPELDRLTSLDASFLVDERGNSRMATGAVLMFAGSPPSQEDLHPTGFLARDHALAVAILGYDGSVSLGVLSDPEAPPDAGRLTGHPAASVEELRAAVSVTVDAKGG